jgi:hypothetical protein
MRVRTTIRSGASPLPGHSKNSDKQTCAHRRAMSTVVPGQCVDDGYTGAPSVSVVGSITVIKYARVSTDRQSPDRQHDVPTFAGPRRPRGPGSPDRLCPHRKVGASRVSSTTKGPRLHVAPRCLHVVVGVLRRSGWRLNAKVTERPPRNL